MKKVLSVLLAAAMLMCVFAACKNNEPSNGGNDGSSVIKIGAIGPTTGEAAIYGTAVKNGMEIAVDEINAKGGIAGAKIELRFSDDVADGETAANAYNGLMDWGMQVLVGPVTTGSAITVSAKAFEDRVFALTPSASSTEVTSGKDNMFQLCFTDPNQGVAAADYMAKNTPDAKIAIIYRNDDAYSQGIRDAFVEEAKEKNLEIVYQGTFTVDTQTDFSVQLAGAQSANADMVFLPIYYQPSSVIFAQAKQMSYAPKFFGVDGMDGILTLENFDANLAAGVLVQSPFSADATDDATAAFVKAYKDKVGENPNQFAADGYDCVYAIKAAFEKAQCTADMTAAEICEKLVETFTSADFSFSGLTGAGMTWSKNGEVTKTPNIYEIEVETVDGAAVGKYVAK